MSEVTSGILQGRCWKPTPSNSVIIDLGTRTWSTFKTFVSDMKRHRVANAEEDRSIVQGGLEYPVSRSNRNRVNCRSTKCKAMAMDSQEAGSLCQRLQGRQGECGSVAEGL